jgi:hypothetical protein
MRLSPGLDPISELNAESKLGTRFLVKDKVMKNYIYAVKAVEGSITLLTANEVKLYKRIARNIGQNGIRYIDDTTVLLQSNSQHDILDCFKNGVWAHSQNPKQIQSGWAVIVVPNNTMQAKYGPGAIGVKLIAATPAEEVQANTFYWTSNVPNVEL